MVRNFLKSSAKPRRRKLRWWVLAIVFAVIAYRNTVPESARFRGQFDGVIKTIEDFLPWVA